MAPCVGAPPGERLPLRDRDPDDQGIAVQPHVAAEADDAVDRRSAVRISGRACSPAILKQAARQHAPADVRFHVRATDEQNAVASGQENRALGADIERVVKFPEIGLVDRNHDHAGEAAVGMIEAPAGGDDPLAAGTAFDRDADMDGAARIASMELKIVPIRIIDPRRDFGEGCRQPLSILVIDEDAAKARLGGNLRHQELMEPLQLHGPGAVGFQPRDHPQQHEPGGIEGLLGVMRDRSCKVGRVPLRLDDGIGAGGIGPPAVDPDQRQADENHEAGGGRLQRRPTQRAQLGKAGQQLSGVHAVPPRHGDGGIISPIDSRPLRRYRQQSNERAAG